MQIEKRGDRLKHNVLQLPSDSPVPFLPMTQEVVVLSPVALCHLLTRNRILSRNTNVKNHKLI